LVIASALSKAVDAFSCTPDAFNGILPKNATTLFAYDLQTNGSFGVANDTAYPKNATSLPPLCVVSINVTSSNTSSFRFGLYLPTQWNGRMYTAGNGGFAGGINWLDMAIETLSKLYGNWIETNQTFVFPNMKYGSEWQWSLVHDGGGDDQFSPAYVRNIVYNNPLWSIWNFSYDTVLDAERVNRRQGLDADNFDLSPFNARGGKLLHYVGLADGLIPAGSSEYYYNHVVRTLVPKNISVDSFYRLFEIPGMGHCARSLVAAPWYINGAGQAGSLGSGVRGVPGFNDAQHDAVLALTKWVEDKVAPTTLIATKYTNDTDYTQGVTSQRPLCPYPQIAVWDGGNMTQAGSWGCANATDYALWR
ncbi:hypothetical protein DV736_g6667, partial [Chaetothyriales sp. CBS 134916]